MYDKLDDLKVVVTNENPHVTGSKVVIDENAGVIYINRHQERWLRKLWGLGPGEPLTQIARKRPPLPDRIGNPPTWLAELFALPFEVKPRRRHPLTGITSVFT